MTNQAAGIITVIFSTLAIYLSWRLFRRKHDKSAILLLAIAGLALRFFTAGDLYLHDWDERFHALVAKNMIDHPLVPTLYDDPVLPYDYKDWTASHIWIHKQPLPLLGMALSMSVFGVNEIALRLPSILLTTLGIWLIFVIGRYFYDRRTGYLAACFYAMNGLILELTGGRMPTDHIDIFFLFFVELAVFFTILYIQKQKVYLNLLAGLSLGLAILSKWLPALIVLPVWLLLVIDSQKFSRRQIAGQFLLLLAVTVAVALPWQIYIYSAFPQEARWEALFNYRHMTEALENNTGPFWYFFDRIRINYGELVHLPLIWFIIRLVKKPRDLKQWALAAWFFVPLIFFSVIRTKMQGYLLFTAPVLFILTAVFIHKLNDWKNRIRYPWLINLLIIVLLAIPVRYAIERSKPFEKRERNPEWVKMLRTNGKEQWAKSLEHRAKSKEHSDKNVNELQNEVSGLQTADRELRILLFNYPRPIEAMFYTGWTVYNTIPDTITIRDLKAKGYGIVINDDGKLPEEMKGLPGVDYRAFIIPERN